MRKTSGLILDVYDDVDGALLRSMFPTPSEVPELVKSAQHLSEVGADLPDDLYALVLVDEGTTLRKFACHDPGNTALSVLYFLKTAEQLPENARVTAAENLKVACGWYGMEPPEELEKVAFGLNTALTAMQVPATIKSVKAGVKTNMAGIRANEARGGIATSLDQMVGKHAEASGTSLMPISAASKKRETHVVKSANSETVLWSGNQPDERKNIEKLPQATVMSPHVDVTGQEPPKVVHKEAAFYALGDRYPLDDYRQVKTASAYFDAYHQEMPHFDRHEFAVKLARRARALDIPLSKEASAYSHETYADDAQLNAGIACRESLLQGEEERAVLHKLAARRSLLDPEMYCAALDVFDKVAGLDQWYGAYVMDPVLSTFGEKVASDWSEVIENNVVTEKGLHTVAQQRKSELAKLFGDDFAKEFSEDPVGIFKSMPITQKKMLATMATQAQA